MKMSEFGEEKVLSQGQPRRIGGLCLPKLQTPEEFQQSILKGKVREGCGWLVQTSYYRNPLSLKLSLGQVMMFL